MLQAGGRVIADSAAGRYEESVNKAKALRVPLAAEAGARRERNAAKINLSASPSA